MELLFLSIEFHVWIGSIRIEHITRIVLRYGCRHRLVLGTVQIHLLVVVVSELLVYPVQPVQVLGAHHHVPLLLVPPLARHRRLAQQHH